MNIILYLLQLIQYQYKIISQLFNFICRYIPLKQWVFDDSHSPKYQKFKVDKLPKIISYKQEWDWQDLICYYEKRYNKTYDDGFMLAWMMLKVADSQGVTALTRPRYKHEVETELKRLCVLDETVDAVLEREWSEFATFLIETYLNSSPYRSMIFGIGAWSQRTTAQRFAREIITVTKTVPGRIGLTAEMSILRDIIQKRFTELVADGEELLKEAERAVR